MHSYSMSHTTVAQDVCPHHVIHASCAAVVLILFDSPFCTLHRLSHLPFHFPDLHLRLRCGLVRGEVHAALRANEELGTLADNNPLTEATTQRLQGHDIVHCVFALIRFGTRIVTFSLLGVRVCHCVSPR